jgi:hypothetical protein
VSNNSNGPVNIVQVGGVSGAANLGSIHPGAGNVWSAVVNNVPQWTQVSSIYPDAGTPTITLKKVVGYETEHSLEKIEPKKWKIINLTFKAIIALQDHGIKYTWSDDDKNVYINFDTEEDESQAIMLIGSIPYDQD